MVGIETIFAIGSLLMVAAGLIGGIDSEKLKIPQLPNWVRVAILTTGIALLFLSVYIFLNLHSIQSRIYE